MAEAVMLILSLVVFCLAGATVLTAARTAVGSVPARLSLSFLIGLGGISLQMFFYSLVPIRFGFLVIALPWVALYVLARIIRRGSVQESVIESAGVEGIGWIGYIFLLVILSQAAYVFAYSVLLPVRGWDAWLIWCFRARVFFIDGGVKDSFLLDPAYKYAHPDYPLLVPLSAAWVYTALGRAAGIWAKLLYPLQFVSMLFVFHRAVKAATTAANAMLFTALLSLTPIIIVHSGGMLQAIGPLAGGDYLGYADLTLSIYMLSAGVFLYFAANGAPSSYIVLSAIFFALGAWTKNEGLPFALFGFLLIIVQTALGRKGLKGLKTLEACVCALALFIVPWAAYKALYSIGGDFAGRMSPAVFLANLGRVRLVVSTAIDYLFFKPGLFAFTWWAFVVSAVLNWRGFSSRPLLMLYLLLFFQLFLYLFVYVVTPFDIVWHMRTSLDRLVLHMIPLGMLITAINAGSVLRPDAPERA